MSQFFEIIMLVCFGFSWPINLVKALKSKTARGTSPIFLTLILIGYACGVISKLLANQINVVLTVYFINILFVLLNLIVFFKNKAMEKQKSQVK